MRSFAASDRFVADVKARKIPPEELRGATITLSNFGMIAGKYAAPIVVPPTVAILGAGAVFHALDLTARGLQAGNIPVANFAQALSFLAWLTALAGLLMAVKVPGAPMIASITFVAILMTILIQAPTTKWLGRRLGLLQTD